MNLLGWAPLPWILAAIVLVSSLVVMRRMLGRLLRLLARTAVGLGTLFAFSQVGGLSGVTLGVNLLNALVLGLLGAPGFGLLLMLNWTLGI